MPFFKQFSRYFVALLFLFFFFLKIVDPIGTGIKMEKYFLIFSENIAGFFEYFVPFGLAFAILIICLEMILGFALLFNYRMKLTAWSLVGLIAVFTVLTFYTAITGAPKDCGCFGDFMKLTPWQSFSKDLVLSVFIGAIFYYKNEFKPVLKLKKGDITLGLLSTITFAFAFYNIFNLPVIDFRPYAIGNDIKELMTNGEDPITHYEFEKDGKKFTDPEAKMEFFKAPYKYIGTVTVKEEVPPSIVDFTLSDVNGEDHTFEILEGKKLLIVVKKAKGITESLGKGLNNIANQAKSQGIEPIIVSSMSYEEFKETTLGLPWKHQFYTLDYDISKAVVRSSIGLLIIENGIITDKKHSKEAHKILD